MSARSHPPRAPHLLGGLVLLALLAGCGEDEPSPSGDAPPRPAPEAHAQAASEPAEPIAPDPPPDVGAEAEETAAPPRGCALGAPLPVPGGAGWTDLVALDDGFLVASLASPGSTAAAERLTLARLRGGALRRAAELDLDYPVPAARREAGPVLARREGSVGLVFVDAEARLLFARVDPARPRPVVTSIAEGASLRFRPALAATEDGWVVAWTDARETPMRVFTRTVDPDGRRPSAPRDLTPLAGGAAAPTAVLGAAPPTLVFLDPRQATSVSLRAALGSGGFARPEVARPVGVVTEPPEIVAARLGGDDWLGYTGIGSLATTAVGIVRLGGTEEPRVLVEGTGYGRLHVDAAPLGPGAVFVADAPQAAPPTSPRELALAVLGPDGALGEIVRVRGPGGRADRGRVAAGATGRIAVSFRDVERSVVAAGRCALPSAGAPREAPADPEGG